MVRSSSLFIALACSALTSVAHAQVVQPNGLVTPRDSANGEVQLYTLFSSRGEAIDFVADGAATPSTFSPLCDFRATYVLNEAGSHFGLAWYNATGSAPSAAELHVIVPGGSAIGTVITSADIRVDPSYAGGEIGFALVGGQTHYTESRWDPVCTACGAPGPWITAVMYRSTVTPDAYYVAFEDGDVTASSFNNDGDYNDDVFFLEGLVCSGGGEHCDTGMLGICADGVSDCSASGITCRPTVTGRDEACNGLDDDCNGTTDEGDLCPVGDVCDRGTCVHACGGEFGCGIGYACEAGFCIDELCVGISCAAGEVCRGGACEGACTGVVCPGTEVCRAGACVDLCEDVTCPAGQVCDEGGCRQSCTCAACDASEACDDASGMCIDPTCVGVSCSAPAICRGATCVDPCDGAVCPHGLECTMGECVPIPPAPDAGTTEVDSGLGGGGDSGAIGEMDAGGAGDGGHRRVAVSGGCGCSVPRSTRSASTALGLAALALVWLSRRRSR
jgi:MYXO-CTERM domain-containing protein